MWFIVDYPSDFQVGSFKRMVTSLLSLPSNWETEYSCLKKMSKKNIKIPEGHERPIVQQVESDANTTTGTDSLKNQKKSKGQGSPNLQSTKSGDRGSSDPDFSFQVDHRYTIQPEYQVIKEKLFSQASVTFKIKVELVLGNQIIETFKIRSTKELSSEVFAKLITGDESLRLGLFIPDEIED